CRARPHPSSTLLPYTTLFRSQRRICSGYKPRRRQYSANSSSVRAAVSSTALNFCWELQPSVVEDALGSKRPVLRACLRQLYIVADRKSTRLNSSHVKISYAVF